MKAPSLTPEQMVEVDRLMMEEFGISLVQMMENAGRNLADLTQLLLNNTIEKRAIVVLCGSGNNGGGGLVAARHLSNRGADVRVVLVKPPENLKEVPAKQLQALSRLPVDVTTYDPDAPLIFTNVDAVIDAMIGYGLEGDPRGPAADLISAANVSSPFIIALDTPSGLNLATGKPGNPCIQADATLTLALPKVGLLKQEAVPIVGSLFVADISVPPNLYSRLGVKAPYLFTDERIVYLKGQSSRRIFSDRHHTLQGQIDEDRFSDELAQVLKLAKREARRHRSLYVSSGHLLLALLREGNNSGAELLVNHGIKVRELRDMVKDSLGKHKRLPHPFKKPRFTRRSRRLLRHAGARANQENRYQITPDDLMVALLDYHKGVARKVLHELDIHEEDYHEMLET